MKLKFSNHFQERIIQRDINVDHIKLAVREPDKKKIVFDDRVLVTKKVGKKTIEVIYYKDKFKDRKEEYIVITGYYI